MNVNNKNNARNDHLNRTIKNGQRKKEPIWRGNGGSPFFS